MLEPMIKKLGATWWCRIFVSGPIETAKDILRRECLRDGLCVTISPTTFIYTGGEEAGFVVGMLQYPRFPVGVTVLEDRAIKIADLLRAGCSQKSSLVMFPDRTLWKSEQRM